jgi:hypothetical protein
MGYSRCTVEEMKNSQRRTSGIWIRCQFVAVIGILFFTIGLSKAQESAPSDVYVAPQRFYAQKLVEDVRAKHPEVIYLNLRTVPPDRTESYKVAMSPPSRGGKSDQADIDAEHGKTLGRTDQRGTAGVPGPLAAA